MEFIFESVVQKVLEFFQGLEASIPGNYREIFSLLLYTLFIVLYSVFIWKFYRFMAKKNIINLNLGQYNRSEHPGMKKTVEVFFNIIEYAIILPFLVVSWFTVFSIFLLLLSKNPSTHQVLLICAAIISSTRITAYISQDLSKDLAKIFPFTVLALFLLEPNFFKVQIIFERIIQIPELLGNILIFLIFIFAVELLLRAFYSLASLIYSDPQTEAD